MRPIPPAAIALIQAFEGQALEPYRDVAGFWTVDTGHLVTRDRAAPRPPAITPEEAETLLAQNLGRAARSVLRLIAVPLTDGQYGALVSFVFNLGGFALQASTLRRRLNEGDVAGAADEFPKWRFAGGREWRGLLRRRLAEQSLFRS